MAEAGRDDTTQQAPPVEQPTEESPALSFEPDPQVVDTTAVEEPVEQEPPVRAAEEEVAPTGGPEPSFEPTGGTSPRDADRAAAEADGEGRPELLALGAFAGGLVVAQILKRLGGGDE
ncbi:MAG: hypothetical protein ACJ77M_01540 [Thermoleophilaceae bacterium]|jgi:hypothetical protein